MSNFPAYDAVSILETLASEGVDKEFSGAFNDGTRFKWDGKSLMIMPSVKEIQSMIELNKQDTTICQ